MRLTLFANLLLVLSGLLAWSQTSEQPKPTGRIAGRVVDQRGQPLKRISVSAVLAGSNVQAYMPAAETNDAGQFVIDGLEAGTYDLFGQNEGDDYPNTALSFYSQEDPTAVNVQDGDAANVKLVLGPPAGVWAGVVIDKVTGKTVVPPHGVQFTVTRVANPDDSILFAGPAKYRWLIPPDVDVMLEVKAEGYQTWSSLLPLRFRSGENKNLTIALEAERQGDQDH